MKKCRSFFKILQFLFIFLVAISCGLEDEGAAFLSVSLTAPQESLVHGESVLLTASATKPLDVPVLYLWYVNDKYQAGITTSQFNFFDQPLSATDYEVKIKVVQGLLTAIDTCKIRVEAPKSPHVTILEQNSVYTSADDFTFHTSHSDPNGYPLTRKWYIDNVFIENSLNRDTLSKSEIPALKLDQTVNKFTIRIEVSNGYSTVSDTIQLTITDDFYFEFAELSYNTVYGQPITVSVSTNAAEPVTFTWLMDNEIVHTGTETSWSFPAVSSPMNQNGTVNLKVRADVGEPPKRLEQSIDVNVTRQNPPALALSVDNTTAADGTLLTYNYFDIKNGLVLKLEGVGTDPDNDPLHYSWYKDNNPLSSEMQSIMLLDLGHLPLTETTHLFTVEVTDSFTPPVRTSIVIEIIPGPTSRVEHINQHGTFTLSRFLGPGPHRVTFQITNGTDHPVILNPHINMHSRSAKTGKAQQSTESKNDPADADPVGDFNNRNIIVPEQSRERRISTVDSRAIYAVGDSRIFWYAEYEPAHQLNPSKVENIDAKLMSIQSSNTAHGRKTVEVWVEKACIEGSSQPKAAKFSQTQANAAADLIFNSGGQSFDDIYDWATAITGEEWGAEFSDPLINSPLIDETNTIVLLFYDIDRDGQSLPASNQSFKTGFFYRKDNYRASAIEHSNEEVMLYLDAVLFAASDDPAAGWDYRDRWPSEVTSTIVHEFQHMANFYQKIRNSNDLNRKTERWLNESCSMMLEDLIANRLQINGPRGVDWKEFTAGSPGNNKGRPARFLYSHATQGLQEWNGSPENYSNAYMFGAWLLRNYGGAGLLSNLIRSPLTGMDSVESAILQESGLQRSGREIMQKWYSAAYLSQFTGISQEYSLNRGSSYNSKSGSSFYQNGSINLAYYRTETPAPGSINLSGLRLLDKIPVKTVAPWSGYFVQKELITSESLNCEIYLPPDLDLTIIID